MNNVRDLMRKAYKELRDECESKRKKSEEDTWQNLARRTLVDTPLDLASKIFQGMAGATMGESDGEREHGHRRADHDRQRRNVSEGAERRRSRTDTDRKKSRKFDRKESA